MDLKTFRESGLLELYLIGACDEIEQRQVEEALDTFPALQEDIQSISNGLAQLAHNVGEKPSDAIKKRLLLAITPPDNASAISKSNTPSSVPSWALPLLGLIALALGAFAFFTNNHLNDLQQQLEAQKQACDSIMNQQQIEYAILDDLQNEGNQQVAIAATDKYSDAQIILISNSTTKKNYLQLVNLPEISADQSYQLWSLKPSGAPIPLTVFQGSEGVFIPVDYEEGTPTYAITIEPLGGKDAPTLEDLIGTWGV